MPITANKERLLRLLFVKEWLLENLMLDLLDYCARFNSYQHTFSEGYTFHSILCILKSMRGDPMQKVLKETLLDASFYFDDPVKVAAVERDVENVISKIGQINDRFQVMFRDSN